ncbi:hypothetical protein GT037_004570 [Alternaria burnsii]|uniref:Uncharacterized protein n=1 Tax=Alternaria burnsii TaxID=1187904 RepID=A0A8H7EH61_9PLEO|nr:uncharacterized protein GT037_004570 [Alternaria burnsii]KAF7677711.1 hypothetical protein GT037_004570 [Alternaria burnsii]
MASNADPDAPRTTEIPALADGGGGGVLAAQADKKPEYYVTVILYKDHKRLPGLIQQVEDAGCVVAMSNCTVAPTFTFIMPKGVRNPLEELAAEKDSHMRCIITKVKKQEAAELSQLERPIVQDVGEED